MANDKLNRRSGVKNHDPGVETLDILAHDAKPSSSDLLYETVTRSGGEPFGAPYEIGLMTLTERIVKYFKQRSFFGFETFEKLRRRQRGNKFTRYGASRFIGDYDLSAVGRELKRRQQTRKKWRFFG